MLRGDDGRKGRRKSGVKDSRVKDSFESTAAGLGWHNPPTPPSSTSSSSAARQTHHSHVDRSSHGKLLFSSRLDSVCLRLSAPISAIGSVVGTSARLPAFFFPRRQKCLMAARVDQREPKVRTTSGVPVTPNRPAVALQQ